MSAFDNILTWLNTPISGAMTHVVDMSSAWHARLMVLAWLVIMPLIVIIARFYKVTPKQPWPEVVGNPFWFIAHRMGGRAIPIVVVIAMLLILWRNDWTIDLTKPHAVLGWLTLILLAIQIIGASFRGTHGGPVEPLTGRSRPENEWPGDHYLMTRRRVIFEYIHKYCGYVLIIAAIITLAFGLQEADAPRWMWLASLAITLFWFAVVVRLQSAGRCMDSYQATWGPDPSLPGAGRAPIGIGIRKVNPRRQDDSVDVQ